MTYCHPRPELDKDLLDSLLLPPEDEELPDTERRPELSEFWVGVMGRYPEVQSKWTR